MAEQQFEENLAEKVDMLISSWQNNNINFGFTDMLSNSVCVFTLSQSNYVCIRVLEICVRL